MRHLLIIAASVLALGNVSAIAQPARGLTPIPNASGPEVSDHPNGCGGIGPAEYFAEHPGQISGGRGLIFSILRQSSKLGARGRDGLPLDGRVLNAGKKRTSVGRSYRRASLLELGMAVDQKRPESMLLLLDHL